jgi:hypothetical protein
MKNNLPLERQVCTPGQAGKFLELLGCDAPGSLWCWKKISDPVLGTSKWILELTVDQKGVAPFVPAYTGDELGVLLPKRVLIDGTSFFLESEYKHKGYAFFYRPIPNIPYHPPTMHEGETEAQAKAVLAIQGLREGSIRKENFHYA